MKRPSTRFYMHFHGWMTVFWAIMLPISVITGLKNSLPYIVGLSVYALMVGHFSSWQAVRAEDKADNTGEN